MRIDIHEKEIQKMINSAKENKEAEFVPLDKLIAKHTMIERKPFTHYIR